MVCEYIVKLGVNRNGAWSETQWYIVSSSYKHSNLLHIPATMFENGYIFEGSFHSLIHNKH